MAPTFRRWAPRGTPSSSARRKRSWSRPSRPRRSDGTDEQRPGLDQPSRPGTRMIKEALVCLEGSQSSEAATRLAITIANDFKARLVGLAIVDEPDIRAGAATGIGGASYKHERDDALVAEARRAAADALALFERRCREAAVDARVLEIVGRPAASILAEMETRDLTVMGRDA